MICEKILQHLIFNPGPERVKVNFVEEMGFEAGRNMVPAMKCLDKERMRYGVRAALDLQKEIRQLRNVEKRKPKSLNEAEDNLYFF
ncbi:hypothetical protein J6590_093978, partial [Homalodisca vitripennis]